MNIVSDGGSHVVPAIVLHPIASLASREGRACALELEAALPLAHFPWHEACLIPAMDIKIVASLFIGVCLAACNPPKEKAQPQDGAEAKSPPEEVAAAPAATVQPVLDVDTYYSQRCLACHGAEGKGDGPGAAAMDPKPRDYTDGEWQASVTDEELKKVILGGGMAVGKSPLMPGNPDLKDKPELVDALVKKVRGFQK